MNDITIPSKVPTPDQVKHPGSAIGRMLLGGAFAALILFIFLKLADEVMEQETMRFDARIINFFHAHSSPAMHAFMAGVTWVGSGPVQTTLILIITVFFLWKRRFLPDRLTALITGLGGMGLEHGLKLIFHRNRPEPVFYHLGYSFPSGHSFWSVIVYGMLAYWLSRAYPRYRGWFWGTAVLGVLLVGFSRVYLRQHYPTDVVGGYLAGICWLWVCLALPRMLTRKSQSSPDVTDDKDAQSI